METKSDLTSGKNARSTEVLTGKVLWYSIEKMYGFLQSGHQDYYFHFSGLTNDYRLPQTDDQVNFIVGIRKGKPIAKNISIIKEQ
jgi:cold shock CspA family protein